MSDYDSSSELEDSGQRVLCTQDPRCKQSFGRDADLQRHINAVHLRIKDHICDVCGKAFSQPSGLKIHMNAHTGETPFVCGINGCDRVFGDPSSRSRHRKQTCMPNGPRYVCPEASCYKNSQGGIKRRDGMKKHLATAHDGRYEDVDPELYYRGPPKRGNGRWNSNAERRSARRATLARDFVGLPPKRSHPPSLASRGAAVDATDSIRDTHPSLHANTMPYIPSVDLAVVDESRLFPGLTQPAQPFEGEWGISRASSSSSSSPSHYSSLSASASPFLSATSSFSSHSPSPQPSVVFKQEDDYGLISFDSEELYTISPYDNNSVLKEEDVFKMDYDSAFHCYYDADGIGHGLPSGAYPSTTFEPFHDLF
ncbi:C2h2 conidiation transcription factor [Mycena kentingensis (nom. inval.)]|nr:C2h2 conidiation transcription factor [Mycena kentingensis (nom. inval.)]